MAPTIDEISIAFAEGFVTLTAGEQRLAQTVYRLLAVGRPVAPDAIAQEAGWPVGDVEQRLDVWPAVFRNLEGAVVGFWGLAAEEVTNHRLDVEGVGTAWTWCSTTPCSSPSFSAPRPGSARRARPPGSRFG